MLSTPSFADLRDVVARGRGADLELGGDRRDVHPLDHAREDLTLAGAEALVGREGVAASLVAELGEAIGDVGRLAATQRIAPRTCSIIRSFERAAGGARVHQVEAEVVLGWTEKTRTAKAPATVSLIAARSLRPRRWGQREVEDEDVAGRRPRRSRRSASAACRLGDDLHASRSRSMRRPRPWRTIGWSSATMTRISGSPAGARRARWVPRSICPGRAVAEGARALPGSRG